ncbi:hypothetical protein M2132_000743 [Dysgonomonas sp. PH5-45]|uniref:hypothetical protein n=1 Tax=unclassified Dysgonomonas TaxID=2630389 RepID=UPI002475E72F|nr:MULTISPECIES: hypothetical protein [unclassified Dysgonomonas]MDH6354415.1 hypothetical protein [Dysgonomonas sp. PH5-45]MDH6387314.1 hypothetical protein [Dysgonomonas sp. PH5-37]
MKSLYGLAVISLLLIGCQNKKEPEVVSAHDVFEEEVDTLPVNLFTESTIVFPYNGNIAVSAKLKPDTLYSGLKGMEKYTGGKDYLLYYPLPDVENVDVVIVPTKSDGYKYRYTLLTVLRDSVVSELEIESEFTKSQKQKGSVSFDINKDYQFSITSINQQGNYQWFEYKNYTIEPNGKIKALANKNSGTKASCFAKIADLKYPINSDDLSSLHYSSFTCKNVVGMNNFSCFNSINYITLAHTENDVYYLLVNSECGDYASSDLVVIKNNKVVSSLTIDSAEYDGDDDNYWGDETTFEITDDFTIKLELTTIKRGKVASVKNEIYRINSDGYFVKQ